MSENIPIQTHADYVNITVPLAEAAGLDDQILLALRPAFPLARKGSTDLYDIGQHDRQNGTLKLAQLRPVYVVSMSGLALLFVRATGCLPNFLEVFRRRDHRITRLDMALDVYGMDGPSFVVALHDQLRAKGIRVGQRRAPFDVHFGFDRRGEWTGTVYIGGRSARVRVAVYDKRHEQESHGHPDPGPWLRIEVRVRGGDQGVPVTLADIADCTALFWAHLPAGIIPVPSNVPVWIPNDPAGFDLPPRIERRPEDDLRRWVQRFGWQGQELADACGPYGRRLLVELLHLVPDLNEIPF